ncbi:hypothetical protein MMC30_006419 [Trapelia coarctata]|nr:hypothetical protein [Trapelia coarctata]
MLRPFAAGSARYECLENTESDTPEHDGMESNDGNNRFESPVAGVAHFRTSDGSPVDMKLPGPFDHDQPRRTVSREGSLPLRHPTPDLQSLQGAYIGNVERLEQSAERLSLSSDIGEELRKMKLEQKKSESRSSSRRTTQSGQGIIIPASSRQFSTGSHTSSSILGLNNVARSGGLSLSGHMASPVGSIRSPSRPHQSSRRPPALHGENPQLAGNEQQELRLDSPTTGRLDTEANEAGNGFLVSNEILESPTDLGESNEAPTSQENQHDIAQNTVELPERPTTAVSTDSYQQRMHLFADFDGVHISPNQPFIPPSKDEGDNNKRSCQIPLREQTFDDTHHFAPEPPLSTQNMVYYPAPVPMMLNLPQKLSKAPSMPLRDKRRSQVLGAISSAGVRNSVLGLPEVLEGQEEGYTGRNTTNDLRRSVADLPPQLRADLYFEHKPIQQTVEMKGDSAVATLDSILDASAHAPVSAFVDHPIAGQVGAEVYGRSPQRNTNALPLLNPESRKRRSSLNILRNRQSILDDRPQSPLVDPRSVSQQRDWSAQWAEGHTPANDYEAIDMNEIQAEAREGEENQDEAGEGGEENDLYTAAPTTLLAELQIRKQQQQQRGRTAATAFPNGMHSTLLELDTVAQVQKQSRKQKHVTLAWEDAGPQNADDEDVPLGMLFPGRKAMPNNLSGRFDENQPLGLIAKRALEDNEPLSQRRARLAGKLVGPRHASPDKRASMYTLEVPGLTDLNLDPDAQEEEHETLAQRLKRLRNKREHSQPRPLSGDFLSEVMSSFGGPIEQDNPSKRAVSRTPHPEETLGQRRRRLQAEKEATSRTVSGEDASQSRPPLQKRHTMADILHARRPGASRTPSSELLQGTALGGNGDLHERSILGMTNRTASGNIQMSSGLGPPGAIQYNDSSLIGIAKPSGIPTPASYLNPMLFSNNAMDYTGYTDMGANGHSIMPPLGHEQVAIDPKQRAMIDRWRQSVM